MRDRVSESDQGRVNCVHQVNVASGLVPVLSLGPLSQRLSTTKGQLPPAWGLWTPKSYQERLQCKPGLADYCQKSLLLHPSQDQLLAAEIASYYA